MNVVETTPSTKRALSICSRLRARIKHCDMTATVHSVFDSAVNLQTDAGLITLLCKNKGLMPYSVSVDATSFETFGFIPNDTVIITNNVLYSQNNRILLESAVPIELDIPQADYIPAERWNIAVEKITELLAEEKEPQGLSPLLFDDETLQNQFSRFIKPRLGELRRAAVQGDCEAAKKAAARFAGCGMGLTPSSDDLLCGYIVMLYMGAAGMTRGDKDGFLVMLQGMAGEAAQHTNLISGCLLRRCGEGLAGEALVQLLNYVNLDQDDAMRELDGIIQRVAAFGHTSGRDILTGVCFGAADLLAQQSPSCQSANIGGKSIGKAGS